MATTMAQNERKFVSIELPFIVKNTDKHNEKLLSTLGGIDKISSTYSNPSHRLELYFRPKDPYCKPAFGDRQNTTNLLLKVKQSKSSDGEIEYLSEILGVVGTTYKFQSMADFQILPMLKTGDSYKAINNELLPTKLEKIDWVKQDAPLFSLPPVFSRLDTPGDYRFSKDPVHRMENPNSEYQLVSQCLRYRRTLHAKSIPFEESDVPNSPIDAAVRQFEAKGLGEEMLMETKKLFENRPIWHRNAVRVALKVSKENVKLVLPVISYTFVSGPWRGLWVRFGYDPRQDNSSRIYQILDFRVRQTVARNIPIQSKRSSTGYVLPNKISQSVGRVPLIRDEASELGGNNGWSELELTYKFDPTICPPVRQLFYQFCDIAVPEVHQLLSECPVQPTCHEKFGWLDDKTYEECRKVLASIIRTLCKGTQKDQEDDAADEDNTMDLN